MNRAGRRGAALLALALTTAGAGAADGGIGPSAARLAAATGESDWLLPDHDYAGTRHSPLALLTRDNVGRLRPVCEYRFEEAGRLGDNPIVHDGVLYATAGDLTVALDAATCAERWRHAWTGVGQGRARPFFKSRGVSLRDGVLVRGTSEGTLLALDAATGRVRWSRPVASPGRFEFITTTPLVVGDQVVVGFGISEYAMKGWIGAWRLTDGEAVWRFDTIPGEGDPAAATWSDPQVRERGGGGVWVTPVLDQTTGTLWVTAGNPVPDFHGDTRAGANLYTGSLLALDAASGALRWHRQFVPHDLHDWDLTVVGPLYASPVTGQPLVAAGGKDGLLRGVDRLSGELRFETPVTTREQADAAPTVEGVRTCPGVLGGLQWSRPALLPAAGLLVVPSVDWCGSYRKAVEPRLIRGQLHLGGSFSFDPPEQSGGWITAVDAHSGAVRWRHRSARPQLAAVTTTASGLVITGELDGHLLVLDGADGRVLLRHDSGTPLHAGVITYAVGGRQYVAVAGGTATAFWRSGTWPATVVVYGLPPDADGIAR